MTIQQVTIDHLDAVWSPDSSRAAFRFAGLTQIVSIPDGRTWTMDTGRDRGGDNLGFLGSRHLLASSNWEDMIRIDDVSLQVPLFRLTGGGHTPTFSQEHSLMGVQNWRKGARIYEWTIIYQFFHFCFVFIF